MRTAEMMKEQIISYAENDDRIRGVILSGSRATPNSTEDQFQDFDIIYVVRDLMPFLEDDHWVDYFGERMIMQMPNTMGSQTPQVAQRQVYLMQFMDGNRIDLSIVAQSCYPYDAEPGIVWLDKDNTIVLPVPSDVCYWVKKPDEKRYLDCCNEFWWMLPNVAKGLCRNELTYVKTMMDVYVRDMWMEMMSWYTASQYDYQITVGKCGRYLQRYMDAEMWSRSAKTYADAEEGHMWEALLHLQEQFRDAALAVAKKCDFCYPLNDDSRVASYIKQLSEKQLIATCKNIK